MQRPWAPGQALDGETPAGLVEERCWRHMQAPRAKGLGQVQRRGNVGTGPAKGTGAASTAPEAEGAMHVARR